VRSNNTEGGNGIKEGLVPNSEASTATLDAALKPTSSQAPLPTSRIIPAPQLKTEMSAQTIHHKPHPRLDDIEL